MDARSLPRRPKAKTLRLLGNACMILGLLLIVASLNGAWGRAYGQTVPTRTPVLKFADPQLSKTGDTCCVPGGKVVFTIVASNVGTAPATDVLVSDRLPPELVLVDVATTKGTVSVDGNYFEVFIRAINPGEIVTITVEAMAAEDAPVDVTITNVAYLKSGDQEREDSTDLMIKEVCDTPAELPDTGTVTQAAEQGTSLWLLVAGLLILLLGVVLSLRGRARAASEGS